MATWELQKLDKNIKVAAGTFQNKVENNLPDKYLCLLPIILSVDFFSYSSLAETICRSPESYNEMQMGV